MEKNRLLMPPLWSVFFAWGFPDNTCAFGTYGSEKVLRFPRDQWGSRIETLEDVMTPVFPATAHHCLREPDRVG